MTTKPSTFTLIRIIALFSAMMMGCSGREGSPQPGSANCPPGMTFQPDTSSCIADERADGSDQSLQASDDIEGNSRIAARPEPDSVCTCTAEQLQRARSEIAALTKQLNARRNESRAEEPRFRWDSAVKRTENRLKEQLRRARLAATEAHASVQELQRLNEEQSQQLEEAQQELARLQQASGTSWAITDMR